jgi:uncharacterized protein (DUF302 family)
MNGIVTTASTYTYAETIQRLTSAITAGGGTLFAAIDQAAAATGAGLTLRPTTLLLFGNPRAGTPLMNEFPVFGLELPLKLLVWDDAGSVHIAYAAIHSIAERYEIHGKDELFAAMDRTLATLAGSVADSLA